MTDSEQGPQEPTTIWQAFGYQSEEEYKAALAESFAQYPLPPDVTIIDCYNVGHEMFDVGPAGLGALIFRLRYKIEVQSKQIDELVAAQFK